MNALGIIAPQLEPTAWDRWVTLAEALTGSKLPDEEAAYRAFEAGVYPEVFVGAVAAPCETCKLPGAPAHVPSAKCQHRPQIRTHCTCSACF